MRLCRFDANGVGMVDGEAVRAVTSALDVLPQVRYPLPKHDPLIADLSQVLARARTIAPSAPAQPHVARDTGRGGGGAGEGGGGGRGGGGGGRGRAGGGRASAKWARTRRCTRTTRPTPSR